MLKAKQSAQTTTPIMLFFALTLGACVGNTENTTSTNINSAPDSSVVASQDTTPPEAHTAQGHEAIPENLRRNPTESLLSGASRSVLFEPGNATADTVRGIYYILSVLGFYDGVERSAWTPEGEAALRQAYRVGGLQGPLDIDRLGSFDNFIHLGMAAAIVQETGASPEDALQAAAVFPAAKRQENLATRKFEAGRYQEAIDIIRPVSELYDRILGRQYTDSITNARRLAAALQRIGNYDEARRVMTGRE